MTRNGKLGLASALAATTVAALVPALVADNYRKVFDSFGIEVPAITAFFLYHHWWLLVVPVAMLGLWVLWKDDASRNRRVGVIGALCAVVMIAGAVIAMAIPTWQMSTI